MDYLPPVLAHAPVVIQQSTDWWPIIIGALATLGGAFGGAWFGARGAYRASVAAGKDMARQSKLEEALCLVDDIERKGDEYLDLLLTSLSMVGVQGAKEMLDDKLIESFFIKAERVYILVKLHANVAEEDAQRLQEAVSIVASAHRCIKNQPIISRETVENMERACSNSLLVLKDTTNRLWESLYPIASTAK